MSTRYCSYEATPKAKERGLKFFYVVSESNIFKQYYVKTIFKLLSGNDSVDRRLFKDFEEAEQAIIASIVNASNANVEVSIS